VFLLTEIAAGSFDRNDPGLAVGGERVILTGGSGGFCFVGWGGGGFQIPPGAWISVSCEGCVLLWSGLCDGPITRPEHSYRLWCIYLCLTPKT